MDPQAFKLKFKYDTALMNLPDAEIADAVDAKLDDDPPPEPPKPSDKARPSFLRVVK
ncbi:MAG: hypothetical protein ACK4RS_07845 [Thiothrix sp.]